MSPAALKRALDPAYIGSPFAQPFQFFDGDASTPMDLTGRAVVLFLAQPGRLTQFGHELRRLRLSRETSHPQSGDCS